ncbi:MAG: cell division protein ZapA [Succinivibrionaceae bacterium]|nr:cell division protein ZapA [Succinivibrionaceae bacterium]
MSSEEIEKVDVEVHGEKFTLRCPAGEGDTFRRAAKDVNRAIGDMQNLTGNRLELTKILSLVAINFSHDLIMKEKEFDGRLVKARDQVKTIINKIDAIGDDFS